MSISRRDVEKVSLLSRLQLTDDELDAMTEQLGQIVSYVDLLSEVDTEGVQPMAHAIEISNVFADDQVLPSLTREEALSAASHRNEHGYLVPAVLGE
jgi:aspartyl-tRNA(Asn)/glutamyl-tRNA(Gln) amidotransferase subunit C